MSRRRSVGHALRMARPLLVGVALLAGMGCADQHVRSSGTHVPHVAFLAKSRTYVVWSTHVPRPEQGATVEGALTHFLQTNHHTVLARHTVERELRAQGAGDGLPLEAADVQRAARGLGAEQVIFSESTSAFHGYRRYLVSVQLRAVDTATGTVLWNGSAALTETIRDDDEGLAYLPPIAMMHALCHTEIVGVSWVEYDAAGDGGCRTP